MRDQQLYELFLKTVAVPETERAAILEQIETQSPETYAGLMLGVA